MNKPEKSDFTHHIVSDPQFGRILITELTIIRRVILGLRPGEKDVLLAKVENMDKITDLFRGLK